MQGDGNGHTGCLDGGLHHVGADLEAAHPLSSTSGALKNQRGLRLLGGLENGERPLEVVGVEGAQRVVTASAFLSISAALTSIQDLPISGLLIITLLEYHLNA